MNVVQIEAVRLLLERIECGTGAYSADPLTHASNCIESMKQDAARALAILNGEANPLDLLTDGEVAR